MAPMPRAASVLMGPAEMALTRMLSVAEVPREIADGAFERGLGQRHHVVVRNDFFGSVVGERHDAAAIGHQRGSGASDGNERVDADFMRDAEAFAAGVEEVSA